MTIAAKLSCWRFPEIVQGHAAVAARLMEHGASPNAAATLKDFEGETPLHMAARSGFAATAAALVDAGGSVAAQARAAYCVAPALFEGSAPFRIVYSAPELFKP